MAVARSENIELQTLTEVKLQEVLAAAEEKDHQPQKQSVKAKWYRRSGVDVGTQYLAVAVSLLFVVGGSSVYGHQQHEEMEQTIRHHRVGVVGGDVVDDDTLYPWMASLQYKSYSAQGSRHNVHKHFCGGTLIRENVVMTAAHCVSWMKRSHTKHVRVVLGTHDLTDTSATMQILKVKRIWVHEFWDETDRFRNDIALLRLKRNVTLDNTVMLASLPTSAEMLPDTTTCYLTGWGATKAGGDTSDKLMQAHLPVIANYICIKPTWRGKPIYLSQLCAGGTGYKSGCQGDSGSPLNCMVNNTYIVHGIDSFGVTGCNVAKKPNVFTRVSYFIGWIQENLNNIPV